MGGGNNGADTTHMTNYGSGLQSDKANKLQRFDQGDEDDDLRQD